MIGAMRAKGSPAEGYSFELGDSGLADFLLQDVFVDLLASDEVPQLFEDLLALVVDGGEGLDFLTSGPNPGLVLEGGLLVLYKRDKVEEGGLLLVDVLRVGAEVSLSEAVEEASYLRVEFSDLIISSDH